MKPSERLLCLFSGRLEQRCDGSYVVEVPEEEVELGTLAGGEAYRVALVSGTDGQNRQSSTTGSGSETHSQNSGEQMKGLEDQPPVEKGDIEKVQIEDLGEHGDGLARVGPGYVVFVPGTDIGDRVTVEITETRESVAFAEVVDST